VPVGQVGSDHEDVRFFRKVADPLPSTHIEPDTCHPYQLREHEVAVEQTDGQAVRASRVEQVVGGDHTFRPRHVLHHDRRRTRQVPRKVTRHDPGKPVVPSPRRIPDKDGHGPPRQLRLRRRGESEQKQ
jgi:hypothetical protein